MKNLAPKKIAVCVSGGGRSLSNLLLHAETQRSWAVDAVVSSSAQCGGVAIAKNAGLDLFVGDFSKSASSSTSEALAIFLRAKQIDWIVLAGFLKLFPALPGFERRAINIHPALLPQFGGKGMYGHYVHEAVIASRTTVSGATVHFVNGQYDDGALITQAVVPVHVDDTPDLLAGRVFAAECKLLPWTITGLVEGRLPLGSGQVAYFPEERL